MIDLPASRGERLAVGVLVGLAAVFVVVWIPRASTVGFAGALTVPLVLLMADLLIAVALLTHWYPVRPVAQGLAVFGFLVHVLLALRNGPMVARGCAGVLALVHVWFLVSLIMLTTTENDTDGTDSPDDTDAPDEGYETEGVSGISRASREDDLRDDAPRAVEITGELRLEVPITDLVDLEPPPRDPAVGSGPEPARPEREQEERTR